MCYPSELTPTHHHRSKPTDEPGFRAVDERQKFSETKKKNINNKKLKCERGLDTNTFSIRSIALSLVVMADLSSGR